MSISGALANALTGLNASARAAEVVSSNVANVMTQGYARREVGLAAQSLGGVGTGVRVTGITRQVDQFVLADRRLSDAEVASQTVGRSFFETIETALGQPGDSRSLSSRVASLESALIAAGSRPDSEARLRSVLASAQDIASSLRSLSDEVGSARTEADRGIAASVETLNQSLGMVDRLNAEILAHRSAGRDATALMDHRQQVIDRIAGIVPIREAARANDQVALFTTGGAVLLEGNPVTIGFTPAGLVTADMTLASGALSGLTINGMAVSARDDGLLGGGSLGAQVQVRDELGPEVQAALDAFARDLIGRFEDPQVDPTLAAGQPGLFTDAGAAFDPLLETGLAGRIALNTLADPDQGGALWRLRDGLGAATPGQVGNATLLNSLNAALTAPRVPASGQSIGAARSASGLAADLLSRVAGSRQDFADRETFATTRQSTLTSLLLENGVDSDAEMQQLLVIEQAYSANAKVVQTMDELIRQLLGM